MAATVHSIEQAYLDVKTAHSMRLGRKHQLDLEITKLREERVGLVARQELYGKTQLLLLKASETARTIAQAKIEQLVTMALIGITGNPYQFKMALVQHAGQWSCQYTVVTPQGLELDPITSVGGGIADICSMALRIAILEMYQPRIDGPILLDESMKFLSRDHQGRTVEFFQMIAKRTGRQIILVTHVPELAAGADTTIDVQPQGDTSTVSVTSSIEKGSDVR